jgi:iron complex transport system substrate-binding protein
MTREPGSTRRRFLASGALLGGALLAGCAGSETPGEDGGNTTTAAGTTGGTRAGTEGTTGETTGESSGSDGGGDDGDGGSESGPYSVSMAPVGDVTFDAVPETWSVYEPGYADMGVALGVAGGLNAVGVKSRYHASYYEQLPGVSMNKQSLTELYAEGIDPEVFYQLGSDVFTIDPQWLLENTAFGLEPSDLDRIREEVAPFTGNTIFRRTDSWHDYRYYTTYGAFETIAKVFGREERYRRFEALYDELVSGVRDRLPEATGRPNGLLVFPADEGPETFFPYRLSDRGTNKKQFHDLGIGDALANTGIEGLSTSDRGTIDYEAMLEVDPDSLLVRGYEVLTAEEFRRQVLRFMREHPVASRLSAVEQGRVFRGGPIYEGPIQNLFLTERFAKAYFPETFTENRLFDRERVANVVTGD